MILKELIKSLDIPISKFERKINVTATSIAKAIERNSEIKESTIEKIKTIYPNVNDGWLKTGEGEMFVAEQKEKEKQNDDEPIPVIDIKEGDAEMFRGVMKLALQAQENVGIMARANEKSADALILATNAGLQSRKARHTPST